MIKTWFIETFQDLNKIGSLASVAGLILSFWILISVKKIQHRFMRKARLPDLLKHLKEISSELSRCPKDDMDGNLTLKTVAGLCAILNNLVRKLPRNERSQVRRLIKSAKRLKGDLPLDVKGRDSRVWELYTDVNGMVQSLSLLQKDEEWEH